MKKSISALAFAIMMALAFVPSLTFAQTFSTPKMQLQEEYSYETVLAIADALEDMDHCSAEQALQWYKEGLMTIEKVDVDTYKVITPNTGLAGVLVGAL